MPPLERVVYGDGRIEVGAFRCSPARPDFGEAGQIRDHCSSHSHFTAAFRKAFGVTPSRARARFRSRAPR